MDLSGFAQRLVGQGDLTIVGATPAPMRLGDGSGPPVTIRLTRRTADIIAADAALKLGEAYTDGSLRIEQGDVYELLEIGARNGFFVPRTRPRSSLARAGLMLRRSIQQWNDRAAARRNVAHHYDISNALYRRFLDADMQYSCAYFADPAATLEQAQAAKKAHIAAKLLLRPGDRVLDIGSGWGGMALTLAEDFGAQVTGITLSTEQLALARERAAARGLSERARFQLADYRDLPGRFDRIVSVGMLEHVGAPNYDVFFGRVAELLERDGVALIHSIGRREEPGITNRWIARHIFPGGHVPALSEVLAAVERAGLWVTDVEVLRLHYAETLRHWRQRFRARWDEIASEQGEAFCRMFDFYLAGSEVSFRYGGLMVFQLQLAARVDAVPLTRDYLGAAGPAVAETPAVRPMATT